MRSTSTYYHWFDGQELLEEAGGALVVWAVVVWTVVVCEGGVYTDVVWTEVVWTDVDVVWAGGV